MELASELHSIPARSIVTLPGSLQWLQTVEVTLRTAAIILKQVKTSALYRELSMPRSAWAAVLGLSAVLIFASAVALEKMGLIGGVRPLTFVSTVICVKFALFALWPTVGKKPWTSGNLLRSVFVPEGNKQSIKLWTTSELRLQQSLFSANVPTFILSNDQRFLDWNSAFSMIFSNASEGQRVSRGLHVKEWYSRLDNYRRVPKRTDKLYGEGILPITDRERVTFISPTYGRMVFSRIMSPIVDRASGRIIGWTVVLNINSVTKRQEFFEDIYREIASETKRIRYASAVDGVLGKFSGRAKLHETVCESLDLPTKVLQLGCGTGALTALLLSDGHSVTAVDHDTHQLRVAKERCVDFSGVKFVRQDLSHLSGIPKLQYGAVVLDASFMNLTCLEKMLHKTYESLRHTGVCIMSCRSDEGSASSLFTAVRQSLQRQGCFENVKHQFNHVFEFQEEAARAAELGSENRHERLLDMLRNCGFSSVSQQSGFDDGHTILVIARK